MSSPIDTPPPSQRAARILVQDGPGRARDRLAELLRSNGHVVELLDPAAKRESDTELDCVLAEVTAGGRDWLGAMSGPALLLLDSFGCEDAWVEDRARGAFDVLARPVSDAVLMHRVAQAIAATRLSRASCELSFGGFDSRDPQMVHVLELAELVAASRTNLLIQGESGTGKTRLARAVHLNSPRQAGPFVELNCGALPDALLMSELFGHVRGAFTGADRDRVGKFEAADGGTIFLDEIATASVEMQVKLLRVLESGQMERVGDNQTRTVDVRVIAACNAPLDQEVAAGRFRADLFWRLNVIAIELPSLRERPADLIALAEVFQARLAREHGRQLGPLSPVCQALLLAHDWPGNVRELENTMERAVLFSNGTRLQPADFDERFHVALEFTAHASSNTDLPKELADLLTAPPGPLKAALQGPEAYLIRNALVATDGQRQQTAALLDINRSTLFNKMRQYGLADFPHGPSQTADPS